MVGNTSTTRRLRRNIRTRDALFSGLGASAGEHLADLPAGVEVVYLVGSAPPSWLPWALDRLPAGWAPGEHYLDATAPVLRYTGPPGPGGKPRRVELHRATQWFGPAYYSTAEAAAAWAILSAHVRAAFPRSTMLATPATTARELFLRTIPEGREWPVLPDDLQTLIRSTSGQGRTEVMPAPPAATLPALYEYDGRLMYAALCWGLPMGLPTYDTLDEYAGQQRGRYRVRVMVPRDWPETFGLLGAKRDDGSRLWRYPAEPGETFEAWVDGAELHVLAKHAPAWTDRLRILERLLWPPHEHAGRGPLDTWAEKLVAIRDDLDALAPHLDDASREPTRLAGLGIRSLLLQGIGAFHGRPHVVTRYMPIGAGPVPSSARNVRLEADYLVYDLEQRAPAGDTWRARLSHPEWSAAIWARARARLLAGPQSTGALHRTAGEVVAFRTDAIYLTERQAWADDYRPGRLRLKRALEGGPYPWPANGPELITLREIAEPMHNREVNQ